MKSPTEAEKRTKAIERRKAANAANPSQLPRYVSVKECAEILGLSTKTFRTMIPEIPGVCRIGACTTRVPLAGLMAWIKQFELKK